jgi:hypothetical protein
MIHRITSRFRAFPKVAEVLPRYLYDLRPPDLATLCRSFAEAEDATGDDICGGMYGSVDVVGTKWFGLQGSIKQEFWTLNHT